jgi:c(7)-type cytochrome triheme protein
MQRRERKRGIAWLGVAILFLAGAAAAQPLKLPPDLVYSKTDGSPGKVIFSHELHVALSDKCTTCHVALFRILNPTRHITHTDMEAGKACGACHNGQMAFGPEDASTCARCHVGEGKP